MIKKLLAGAVVGLGLSGTVQAQSWSSLAPGADLYELEWQLRAQSRLQAEMVEALRDIADPDRHYREWQFRTGGVRGGIGSDALGNPIVPGYRPVR